MAQESRKCPICQRKGVTSLPHCKERTPIEVNSPMHPLNTGEFDRLIQALGSFIKRNYKEE